MADPDGASSPASVALPVTWPVEVPHVPIAANQFATQLGAGPDGQPEAILLTVGFVAPPLIVGGEEEVLKHYAAATSVPVRTLAQFTFSRTRAAELVEVLAKAIANWDNVTREAGGPSDVIDSTDSPTG